MATMARDYRQQPIHVSEVDDEVVALCRQNQVQSNFVAKRLSSESPRHPIRSAHKNVLLSLGVMLFGIWHNRQSYRSTICCNRAWRSCAAGGEGGHGAAKPHGVIHRYVYYMADGIPA
jgi:hypothetical protein